MRQYLDLIDNVLTDATYKPNRTGVDTLSSFSQHYRIDLQQGFPLLTTKDLSGFRWNSLIHEFLWYLSGDEHIRSLQKETSIWDAWADDDGRLDTAYGRFWRRYPLPKDDHRFEGETWPDESHRWCNSDGTFDQLQYVIDTLKENPHSRRLVVNAWHPANATVSTLPPCHYTFVCNVQGDRLNCHLTQRSGDTALGIPFNIAAYSLLTHVIAQETGFEVGTFGHTIVDAHIYCGTGARGQWYGDNLEELRSRVTAVDAPEEYVAVREWLREEVPAGETDQRGKPYDHVPNLLLQCSRAPRDRPTIEIEDVPLSDLTFDSIQLRSYDSAAGLDFGVAE
ncbi:thymidylate synthase [Halorubraceae archaeon YAN]|nr:thymidylate synthase [Halorubraceae archaeon YAN]